MISQQRVQRRDPGDPRRQPTAGQTPPGLILHIHIMVIF
jgi:hypothetical protein